MKKESLTPTESRILSIASSKVGKIIKLFGEGTPYLNTVYTGIVGGIEKKNLIIFMQDWSEKYLDEKIDEKNKQQAELVAHAVLKSIRCAHDKQVKEIINILANAFDGKIETYADADDLINIITELSTNEAVVLKNIYDIVYSKKENQERRKKSGELTIIVNDAYADVAEITAEVKCLKNRMSFYVGRLVGKGLIVEKGNQTIDDIGSEITKYTVTQVGDMLIKFSSSVVDN